jgi:DUF4097 and DUF4098 domain-containing protein YvlB
VVSERGSIEMRSAAGEGILETGSGDITCRLAGLSPGGRLRMKTGNGDLSLMIPSGTSARLAAETGRGRVRVNTGLTSLEKDERRSKRGLLGAGNGEIILETGTGDVTVDGY